MGWGMSKRYSIAGLQRIYGASPADTTALIELKRWRSRADELIRENQVATGLDLIAGVSELTQDYKRSRRPHLAPADRLKLILITTPVQQELVPVSEVDA